MRKYQALDLLCLYKIWLCFFCAVANEFWIPDLAEFLDYTASHDVAGTPPFPQFPWNSPKITKMEIWLSLLMLKKTPKLNQPANKQTKNQNRTPPLLMTSNISGSGPGFCSLQGDIYTLKCWWTAENWRIEEWSAGIRVETVSGFWPDKILS